MNTTLFIRTKHDIIIIMIYNNNEYLSAHFVNDRKAFTFKIQVH